MKYLKQYIRFFFILCLVLGIFVGNANHASAQGFCFGNCSCMWYDVVTSTSCEPGSSATCQQYCFGNGGGGGSTPTPTPTPIPTPTPTPPFVIITPLPTIRITPLPSGSCNKACPLGTICQVQAPHVCPAGGCSPTAVCVRTTPTPKLMVTSTPTVTPKFTIIPTPTLQTTIVCGGTGCGGTTSGGFGGAKGGIFVDTNGSKCVSGSTLYADSTPITLHLSDSEDLYRKTIQSTGSFAFSDVPISSSNRYVLSLSDLPTGYLFVNATSTDGAVTFQSGSAHFMVQGPLGISLCISKTNSWFQTDTGDVRFGTVFDNVPSGLFASTDKNNPGIFFSNVGTSFFGVGAASQKNWVVNNEFFGNNGISTLGSASYDFYMSRVRALNTQVIDVSDQSKVAGCLSATSCALTNLSTGVYQFGGTNGTSTDVILTNLSMKSGAHVTLLVNGNLTIQFPTDRAMDIPVGNGGLLIVAAKGDISISSSTGMSTPNTTTTTLVGIFSAQGDITINSKADCPTTSDNRLNVAGTLIANALNPFMGNGKGTLINHRSLCTANQNDPTLFVAQRPDFALQLTDFYKSSSKTLREVNP